jgi:hypothetical protein
MSVFHMHVENAEQVHAYVPFLKPQRPTGATSRFKGEFGNGGGGVGDGVHVGVEPAGISKGAIQRMAWMERMAGRRSDCGVSLFVPLVLLLVHTVLGQKRHFSPPH